MTNGSCVAPNVTSSVGVTSSLNDWHAIICILLVGVLAIGIAQAYNFIQSFLSSGQDNLDADFDAGGKVSMGLTATTVVSQWTWAATLLQSSAVAAKYGISGPFWYAAGATIQLLLFSMISVQLKVRAPGAKTFLRVIQARFGRRTHITFCVFALLTNTIVTAMLMLGGIAVMTSLVKGLSVELATALVAGVTGGYTYMGGLGATFYVSYFNTSIVYSVMLVFLVRVFFDPQEDNPLGSIETVYQYLNCSTGPEGNAGQSYLTIVSYPGLMFGIINIVGNFGTVFVDQAYWQSSVASKPKQGVWGFLSGGISWFAVPFTFATTMGLAYIALSARQGEPLLSDEDVNSGLVAPAVAQRLMGTTGEVLVLVMILMAVTSTGSAEIIAVVSILVYDIYQIYLKPYRMVHDANSCILCGRMRGRNAHPRDKCICISMTHCSHCANDDDQRSLSKRAIKPDYRCTTHGPYRLYNDYLLRLKNWCMLWTTLAVLPLTLILKALQVSLGWVYLFMGVLIGSAVIPIVLAMCWPRLTGAGMMAGSVSGAACALVSWLIVSALQPGGLSDFFASTGKEESMLTGNIVAIVMGGIITVVVSFATNRNYDKSMDAEVWENTRDIDNPLSPWTEMYARELHLTGADKLDSRPSLADVMSTFRMAQITANTGALTLSVLLLVLWPAGMVAAGVLGYNGFRNWVNVSAAWGFIAALFIMVMPVISEGLEIRSILKEKRTVSHVSLEAGGRGKQFTREKSPPNVPDQSRAPTSNGGSGSGAGGLSNPSFIKDGDDEHVEEACAVSECGADGAGGDAQTDNDIQPGQVEDITDPSVLGETEPTSPQAEASSETDPRQPMFP